MNRQARRKLWAQSRKYSGSMTRLLKCLPPQATARTLVGHATVGYRLGLIDRAQALALGGPEGRL